MSSYPSTLKCWVEFLKISGIAEVPPPTLSFTNITSESFAFTEQKPYEITCDYNSNIGGILRPVDEKSIQLFKVLELEPFTDVKINYLCKARDGASSNGSFTVKTEKPTPPAPPILALKEAKQDKLDLSFVPREGFSYQATSNIGTLKINNGIINISNLKPGEEVLVTTTITDPYDQSSTSKPQLLINLLPLSSIRYHLRIQAIARSCQLRGNHLNRKQIQRHYSNPGNCDCPR